MKRLVRMFFVTLVLTLVVLVSAQAETNLLTIEEMSEKIADVVGYQPYCIEEIYYDDELEMETREWTFIMIDCSPVAMWPEEEDIEYFLEWVADYQYDWYQQLPEMVEISTEKGLDIKGEGIHFEVNPIYSTDDWFVLDWMVWSEKVEDFIRTEDGYIFSKRVLANLVYIDEMSSVRYVAGLLEEAMQ